MIVNDVFTMEIGITDALTGDDLRDIGWKGHKWHANLTLYRPQMYTGVMQGDGPSQLFDNETATAIFNVSLTAPGHYFLMGHLWSVPEDYAMTIVSDPIGVLTYADMYRIIETSYNITIRFNYDYSYVIGKEDYFIVTVMNKLLPVYTNVTLRSYSVGLGRSRSL